MVGYKKIIENMVELEVSRFIEKQSGSKFASCVDGVTLSTDDKKLGYPRFELEMNVPNNTGVFQRNYLILGYVDDYGSVRICSVEFVRNIKKPGENDFRTVHEFLYGDDLKNFKFDR